ncbi:pentapeptide repeat-containing protein [Nonomuraea sp. NPDC049784]|uniref:pentapeptide repeat-containing protein n=1 Tax=Nonomuraea sp. NPDC049784 TaxID=3154361 RepID=UPI0033D80440
MGLAAGIAALALAVVAGLAALYAPAPGWARWVLLGIALTAVISLLLALLLGPGARRLAGERGPLTDRERRGLSANERIEAVNAARHTVIQAATGLVVIGGAVFTAQGLWYTAQTLDTARQSQAVTEQGQITDRYTKAVDQLGSGKTDARLGGVYALERLAKDSPRDHSTIYDVLAAFVREHDPAPKAALPMEPATDVQAALTVIGRRDTTQDRREKGSLLSLKAIRVKGATLPGADLARADLTDANLSRADLNHANLNRADLPRAKLASARLDRAKLTGTSLNRAVLTDAFLVFADLTGADLLGADLTGADLRFADLTGNDLSSTTLAGARLKGANLTDADLSQVRSLTRAELDVANLTRANLDGAKLTDADLGGANLTDAYLRGANLAGADLGFSMDPSYSADPSFYDDPSDRKEVPPTRANLTRANLDGAKLTRANLQGANLTGADLSGVDLTGADLRGVTGLSEAAIRKVAKTDSTTLFGPPPNGSPLSPEDRQETLRPLNKALITATELVDAGLVTHFSLPDHKQTTFALSWSGACCSIVILGCRSVLAGQTEMIFSVT